MKPDDFEKQLRETPFRPAPIAWRADILKAARVEQASCLFPQDARLSNAHETRHATGRSRQDACSTTPQSWWRELLWPCPKAWAGLAAAWVVILACQYTGSEPRSTPSTQSAKAPVIQSNDRVVTAGLRGRAWAMLIDLPEPAEPPKPAILPRRSRLETSYFVV